MRGCRATSWRWWCSTRCCTRSIRRRSTQWVAASSTAPTFAPPSGGFPATCGRAPGRRRTCICCCGNGPETGKPAPPVRPSYVELVLARALAVLLLLSACATPYQPFEGRPVLAAIRFEGNHSISGGELLDHIATAPTSGFFSKTARYYDADLFAIDIKRIERWYNQKGFYEAKVENVEELRDDKGRVTLLVKINEGRRAVVRKMEFTGAEAVPHDDLSDVADALPIHPGEGFDEDLYEKAPGRPFAGVRASGGGGASHSGRWGLGGSAEESGWALARLRGEYTNRSLLGGLRRLALSNTAGYAFVPNPFPGQYDPARSGITTLTSAQLTIPNMFVPGLDWISRAEFAREIQSSFSYDDVAARTGLLYRRAEHTVGLSLNFVRYFKVDVRGDTTGVPGIVNDCPISCTLTYPELRYSYDGRDNAIEPTNGFFGTIGLQQTLKPGTFSYFRINPDLRGYAPLGRIGVLALRVEYGGLFTATANGASPFTQRFFFGGQNEQRGYQPLQQGPKIGADPCLENNPPGCGKTLRYATTAVGIGGKAAALVSAELRIHADFILNHLGIVPFVDASNVPNDPKLPLEGGLEVAPGLGLRYLTPFGPVRLDVAYLVRAKDVFTPAATATDSTGATVTMSRTRVSASCPDNTAGCIPLPRFAFHVSLGEAF